MTSIRQMEELVWNWTQRHGWLDKEVPFPEAIALIHSEASEALEAWRESGFEDLTPTSIDMTIPKPEGVGSEFADILIRLLHYARLYGVDLVAEFERKMRYNETRPYRNGGKRA